MRTWATCGLQWWLTVPSGHWSKQNTSGSLCSLCQGNRLREGTPLRSNCLSWGRLGMLSGSSLIAVADRSSSSKASTSLMSTDSSLLHPCNDNRFICGVPTNENEWRLDNTAMEGGYSSRLEHLTSRSSFRVGMLWKKSHWNVLIFE